MDNIVPQPRHKKFSNLVPEEWPYFVEWARRFDDYPLEKRYGILIMGAEPKEENMIYASDPLELRLKQIDYLIAHPELLKQSISGFVHFLQWLEGMEGKKNKIHKFASLEETVKELV